LFDSTTDHALHHVAIAVHSLDDATRPFELLTGATRSPPETLESQGVRVTFVGTLELLEPLSPDTPVGRFLAKRGQALHHIAYRTRDIRADLARLARAGWRLVDSEPRPGAHGHLVAFVHPSSTAGILTELVEVGDADDATAGR